MIVGQVGEPLSEPTTGSVGTSVEDTWNSCKRTDVTKGFLFKVVP